MPTSPILVNVYDSSLPKTARERVCDYCGAPLPPIDPRARFDARFCSPDHKNAYWTEARKVGDAALQTAKAVRSERGAA